MKNVQQIKQACDPDLYVNMLANDPAHLARAKEKAAQARRANRAAYHKAVREDTKIDRAAGLGLALTGLWALALAVFV